MHPRQHANLNRDRANLVERAMVRARPLIQHLVAEDLLAQQLVVLAQLLRRLGVALGQRLLQRVLDLLHQRVALELGVLLRVQRVLQLCANLRRQFVQVNRIDLHCRRHALRLARQFDQLLDRRADLLDLHMRELDRVHHLNFAALLRPRLHHHNAVFCSDNHDVEQALRSLRVRRVHDERVVDQPDAHRAHRSVEWNVAQRQRAARAVHPQHIGIVLLVRRVDERNHLRLIAEGRREERTNRPVDLPARQDLFLARPSLALDESAGNPSPRVCVLAVLHRQREEVDSLLGVGRGHGRRQYCVVAASGERCAGGLLGHASGLKGNPLAAGKLYCHFLFHSAPLLSFFCQLRKLGAAPLNNVRRVAARSGLP